MFEEAKVILKQSVNFEAKNGLQGFFTLEIIIDSNQGSHSSNDVIFLQMKQLFLATT